MPEAHTNIFFHNLSCRKRFNNKLFQLKKQLRDLELKDSHIHLNFLSKNKLNLEKLKKNLLPCSYYELLINFQNIKIVNPLSVKLSNKFHILQQKQNQNLY